MKWPQRWVAAYVVTLPEGKGKGHFTKKVCYTVKSIGTKYMW